HAIVGDEPDQRRHEPPVSADHPTQQALVREVVDAARGTVTDARGVDDREVARLAARLEAALERGEDGLGYAEARAALDDHRVSALDQPRRRIGVEDPRGSHGPAL